MENTTEPKFGFNNFAETWNGRLAMLGFVIGLATELITGQGILSQIGLVQIFSPFRVVKKAARCAAFFICYFQIKNFQI